MGTSQSEAVPGLDLRLLAAKAIRNLLGEEGVAAASSEQDKAERFGECIRSLETEKAKMEAFRKELPMSVHLVGDVIGWLKDEAYQRQMPTRELFAPAPAKRKVEDKAGAVMRLEVDANDKMDWMSSAQLWSCGNRTDTTDTSKDGSKGRGVKKPSHKVPNALNGSPTLAAASEKAGNTTPPVLAELSLSSPATDGACPVSPNANGNGNCSTIYQLRAEGQPAVQRKARRCWSAELHRLFVAVLQRLGGAQAATPKQIKEMMKVDGLTNDEVKSHLQKYRLHRRRAAGQDKPAIGLWPRHEQRRGASQDKTLRSSASPEVHLQTSGSSQSQPGALEARLQLSESGRAVSVTAGDSYEAEEEDRRSESCSVETRDSTTS